MLICKSSHFTKRPEKLTQFTRTEKQTRYLKFQNAITFDLGEIIEPNQMLWLRIDIILQYIPDPKVWIWYLRPHTPKPHFLGALFEN